MHSITFFKNVRKDGGMHIGLEADGVLLFDDLQEGPSEPDPALDWYLDIQCESKKIPESSENIRNWLLGLSPGINGALDELVKKLEIGADGGIHPFQQKTQIRSTSSDPINLEIKGSAIRSIRAPDIANYIREFRDSWQKELVGLPLAESLV